MKVTVIQSVRNVTVSNQPLNVAVQQQSQPNVTVQLAGTQGPPGIGGIIANDLVTNDPFISLSAAQGVVLDQKISTVRVDYGDHDSDFLTAFNTALT